MEGGVNVFLGSSALSIHAGVFGGREYDTYSLSAALAPQDADNAHWLTPEPTVLDSDGARAAPRARQRERQAGRREGWLG